MIFGIDVSHHQGAIDFKNVSKEAKFCIMKISQGTSFRDNKFETYYNAAKKYMPVGCYIYNKVSSIEAAELEAKLALKILNGREMPLGVWLDMEDSSMQALGKSKLSQIINREAEIIKAAGYDVGIYCNAYWYTSVIDGKGLATQYPFWIARYSSKSPKDMDGCKIWQYSSKGQVPGIKGNVDMDLAYVELNAIFGKSQKKSTSVIAIEVIDGLWGNAEERKRRLTEAGYNYTEVQSEVNRIIKNQKSIDEVVDEVLAGIWGTGTVRRQRLEKAGYNYNEVQKRVNERLR